MIEQLIKDTHVKHLRSLLKRAKNVVLTCHVRPDGDAIGSTLGLMHMLTDLGIEAKVVTPDMPPRVLRFLPGYTDVVPYTKYSDYGQKLFEEADLIIGCDFNTPKRLSELERIFNETSVPKIIIDHHEHPADFANLLISYPDMSSTCELVFRLMAELGLFDVMSLNAATCLCAGIITDTRNLSVNTRHLDLYDIVKALLEKGVNKRLILKETMETKSEDALKLTSFALCERLKVYPKHRAAVVWLSEADLERFNYEKGDTEGLVNQALELRGIIYAIFLRQEKEKIRLSMRSLGSFPVNKICSEHFGGGGHMQAAGGDFIGSLQDCLQKVEECLGDYDVEVRRAADRLSEQGYMLK